MPSQLTMTAAQREQLRAYSANIVHDDVTATLMTAEESRALHPQPRSQYLEGGSRAGRRYDAGMYSGAMLNYLVQSNAAAINNATVTSPHSWISLDYGAVRRAAQQRTKVDAPSKSLLVRTRVTAVVNSDPRTALAVEAEDLLGYTPLRDDAKAPGALRRALAALEIDVLDPVSVAAYKAQMVQHYETHAKMSMPTWRLTLLADWAAAVPEFVLRKAVDIKKALPQARFYVDHLAVDPFLLVSIEAEPDPTVNVVRELDPETQAYIEVWDEPKFEEAL